MSGTVASTQWSRVLAARDGTDTEARAALGFLIQTYWEPLYAYIRSRGHTPEEASDLTQAMKEQKLLKAAMARRIRTSRSALNRLLDPDVPSVTLLTLERAARALGMKLHIELA